MAGSVRRWLALAASLGSAVALFVVAPAASAGSVTARPGYPACVHASRGTGRLCVTIWLHQDTHRISVRLVARNLSASHITAVLYAGNLLMGRVIDSAVDTSDAPWSYRNTFNVRPANGVEDGMVKMWGPSALPQYLYFRMPHVLLHWHFAN